jgi:drug/metabolite transporter (DMT)-like permease
MPHRRDASNICAALDRRRRGPMVYLVAVCAAAALGLGWVLQQRIAAEVDISEMLSIRMLLHLMRSGVWWAGIAAMAIGQSLAGLALQLGPVTAVGPVLSANLLFAFVIRAVSTRRPPRRPELVGAVLLCVAVGVFLAVANPRASHRSSTPWPAITLSAVAVAAMVAVLVLIGKRSGLVADSILLASAAGVLYGLQDATTRGGLVSIDRDGVTALIHTAWPYLLLASAVVGVLLAQSAFRAARLDYSLPPITIAEPLVAGALGIVLLSDRISTNVPSLAVELLCIAAMVVSAILIGRSRVLAPSVSEQLANAATTNCEPGRSANA